MALWRRRFGLKLRCRKKATFLVSNSNNTNSRASPAISRALLLTASKPDKLPLETEPVALKTPDSPTSPNFLRALRNRRTSPLYTNFQLIFSFLMKTKGIFVACIQCCHNGRKCDKLVVLCKILSRNLKNRVWCKSTEIIS